MVGYRGGGGQLHYLLAMDERWDVGECVQSC